MEVCHADVTNQSFSCTALAGHYLWESVPASDPATTPETAPPRSFLQRRIVGPIVAQLTQGLTPHKIALTIAIGSSIAMFPILGTTMLLCLLVGIFMKLNQPIIQAVNLACTPIHLPFIFYSFRWGERLFGEAHNRLQFRAMMNLLRDHPWQFIQDYDQTAAHAIVIWAALVPFWSVAIYYFTRPLLQGIEKARVAAAAEKAAEKAKTHPVP